MFILLCLPSLHEFVLPPGSSDHQTTERALSFASPSPKSFYSSDNPSQRKAFILFKGKQ